MDFDIFRNVDTSDPGSALLNLPTVIGAGPDDPSPEFIVRGRIGDLQYEVLLLKFGVDRNNSEIDMNINGRSALDGLAQFFATTPPILKFNLTMRIDPFLTYVEYDPNFLLLLGDAAPVSGSPDVPASAIVSAGLEPGIIAAIVVVVVVVFAAAVIAVIIVQKRKFSATVRVNVSSLDSGKGSSDTTPVVQQQKSATKPQQPGRWRAFSSEDARAANLRNTDAS